MEPIAPPCSFSLLSLVSEIKTLNLHMTQLSSANVAATIAVIPDLLWFTLFLAALWILGKLFGLVHSETTGQIIAGVLFMALGTELIRGQEAMFLLGQIGLMCLVFEGGLNIDLHRFKRVAIRSTLIAFIGSVLPVAFGTIYLHLILKLPLLESISSGASLASSSIAIATVLMQKRKVIHTPMGTLITAAAMIDDIFSLVLLALTTAINKSETGAIESNEPIGWTIARPILFSFLVVGVGTLVAWLLQLGLARPLTRTMVTRVKTKLGSERSKIAFLLIMLGFSFIWSISAAFSGASYLLGSFVAGLSFSSLPESRRLWEEHVTPIQSWLVAVFFGTIGFLIPVNILFDPWALLYGALIYTAISFLAKFLTGLLTSPFKDWIVVGFAMVGRGELGLVMAAQAVADGVMSQFVFAMTVWAVTLCTVLSPILFGWMLSRRQRLELADVGAPVAAAEAAELGEAASLSRSDASAVSSASVSRTSSCGANKEQEEAESLLDPRETTHDDEEASGLSAGGNDLDNVASDPVDKAPTELFNVPVRSFTSSSSSSSISDSEKPEGLVSRTNDTDLT